MKAQCPNCKTTYNIDDAKIPEKGAHVTCARCQTRFDVHRPAAPSPRPAQDNAKKQDVIITCPSCDHINLSTDKCTQCGYIFSAEDKAKLIIKI